MPLRPYLAGLAGTACVALALGGVTPALAAAPTSAIHHSVWRWHAGHRDGAGDHHWSHGHHWMGRETDGATAPKSPKSPKPTAGGHATGSTGPTSSTRSTASKGSTGSTGASSSTGATASPSGAGPVGSTIGGYTVAKVLHLTATAYGPSLQDNYPYGPVDAFGKPLVAGDVAVDPSVIPLNTHLYVAGYHSPNLPQGGEMAVARDTGGAIQGARIDMFINGNAQQVSNFGVQRVTVYVLK